MGHMLPTSDDLRRRLDSTLAISDYICIPFANCFPCGEKVWGSVHLVSAAKSRESGMGAATILLFKPSDVRLDLGEASKNTSFSKNEDRDAACAVPSVHM